MVVVNVPSDRKILRSTASSVRDWKDLDAYSVVVFLWFELFPTKH